MFSARKALGIAWKMVMVLLILVWVSSAEVSSPGRMEVCPQDCSFSSIQAAIDAAEPGALIRVGAGIYEESLVITKDLTLQGEGADRSIIKGEEQEQVVRRFEDMQIVISIKDAQVTIRGFSIIGGCKWPSPGSPHLCRGISLEGEAIAVIRENHISGHVGPGIMLWDNSQALISGNTITDNADGVVLLDSTQANIAGNVIQDNHGRGGIGIELGSSAQANIYDNKIIGNEIINIDIWGQANIRGNVIAGSHLHGYGIYIRAEDSPSQVNILENSIHDNGVGIAIGGDYFYFDEVMAQANIQRNEIYDNNFEGIVLNGNGEATISWNRVYHNGWAGVAIGDYSSPSSRACASSFSPDPFIGGVVGWGNEIYENSWEFQCEYPPYCPEPPEGIDLCPADYPWPEGFKK